MLTNISKNIVKNKNTFFLIENVTCQVRNDKFIF